MLRNFCFCYHELFLSWNSLWTRILNLAGHVVNDISTFYPLILYLHSFWKFFLYIKFWIVVFMYNHIFSINCFFLKLWQTSSSTIYLTTCTCIIHCWLASTCTYVVRSGLNNNTCQGNRRLSGRPSFH